MLKQLVDEQIKNSCWLWFVSYGAGCQTRHVLDIFKQHHSGKAVWTTYYLDEHPAGHFTLKPEYLAYCFNKLI